MALSHKDLDLPFAGFVWFQQSCTGNCCICWFHEVFSVFEIFWEKCWAISNKVEQTLDCQPFIRPMSFFYVAEFAFLTCVRFSKELHQSIEAHDSTKASSLTHKGCWPLFICFLCRGCTGLAPVWPSCGRAQEPARGRDASFGKFFGQSSWEGVSFGLESLEKWESLVIVILYQLWWNVLSVRWAWIRATHEPLWPVCCGRATLG